MKGVADPFVWLPRFTRRIKLIACDGWARLHVVLAKWHINECAPWMTSSAFQSHRLVAKNNRRVPSGTLAVVSRDPVIRSVSWCAIQRHSWHSFVNGAFTMLSAIQISPNYGRSGFSRPPDRALPQPTDGLRMGGRPVAEARPQGGSRKSPDQSLTHQLASKHRRPLASDCDLLDCSRSIDALSC
jgi:hypothetical protein